MDLETDNTNQLECIKLSVWKLRLIIYGCIGLGGLLGFIIWGIT